ncbi:MAG: thioredoxin fold domain-containing protein [Gammaproteobacteria bacterium]|nr:thioredoxin fold domain-containing protein [Gammaproteobacteria bacterium]
MKKVENWQVISKLAKDAGQPIILLIDQSDCPFCRRVESEFFAAIFAGGEFSERAIFGKVSIDEGETIVNKKGDQISTREFLSPYSSDFTPTVLFIDGEKNELVERMVGLMTPDYYGYYLEKSIEKAISLVLGG